MQVVKDLFEFLWLVATNWAGYATGGLVVAIAWLYYSLKQENQPRRVAIAFALVFLFLAFFNAWRDQKSEVVRLQSKFAKPNLGGSLVNFYTFLKGKELWLVVGGTITNPQGPPTGTLDWSLRIDLNDGTSVKGLIPMNSGKDVVLGPITLAVAKYWPFLTANVIPAGGLAEGWYWAVFPEVSPETLIDKKAVAILQFKDAASNSNHEMKVDVSRAGLTMAPVL